MKPNQLPFFIVSFLSLAIIFTFGALWYGQVSLRTPAEVQKRISQIERSNGRFDPRETVAFFNNQSVIPPKQEFGFPLEARVLAAVAGGEKWIEIDLTNQKIRAHEGEEVLYEFPISSGKPWTPTVTGEFRIWSKFKYTKMSGGSRALGTYYYLPNVPFTMYFYRDYGIHGTYWHNNFGNPMSHGCVNMRTPDAERLFYWASPQIEPNQWSIRATQNNPGTKVIVHGTTPRG